MTPHPPRILLLGAHPDDAEFHAGGLLSIYHDRGYAVKIVSVTNGAAGHHARPPQELAAVRRAETQAVTKLLRVAYEVWDFPDGALQPTLDARLHFIRAIRAYQPDLILTHRPNDYHPDHRAVGQLVQDASYLVTVPLVADDTPVLRRDPVVAYMTDLFTRPAPLRADVVVDITPYFERVVRLLDCHVSQVYEWLPYNQRLEEQVPTDLAERLKWLGQWFSHRPRAVADRFRSRLVEVYGPDRGARIEYAEAYEISEYAAPLDDEARARLFPIFE